MISHPTLLPWNGTHSVIQDHHLNWQCYIPILAPQVWSYEMNRWRVMLIDRSWFDIIIYYLGILVLILTPCMFFISAASALVTILCWLRSDTPCSKDVQKCIMGGCQNRCSAENNKNKRCGGGVGLTALVYYKVITKEITKERKDLPWIWYSLRICWTSHRSHLTHPWHQ